ncbi:MAG: hypothetical protein ACKPKO_53575 [Candidatus Fonsibacter sp.]
MFNKSFGKYHDQRRPEEVSSYVWWEMMNKDERIQWWRDHPDVRLVDASLPAICCHPLGIVSLIDEVPPIMLKSLMSFEHLETDSSDEDFVDQPSIE